MPDDAGPPPKGAPAGRAAGRAIRVVDAPRKAKGVLAYSADELARLLHDLVEAGVVLVADDGGRRASADAQAAHTFVQLACAYKRQLTELPLAGGVPLLAIRQALYDTGVIPYGMNASTSVDSPRAQGTPQSSSGPVMVGGLARSPHAKELWQGSPPRKALGFSLPGWAVAAAREDRLDLDSLIVLPARIGRAGTQLGGLALSAQEWNINAGCIPPGLAQLAGPILLAGGAGRAGGRESGQALRALLGHISAFFLKFKPATKAHPKLLEGRLQRGSYTQRHRVLDNEAYAVSTASESEIRELSIALLAVHEFLLSGAAMLVQGMLFPPPSPPEGESDAVSVSGMVVHNKLPVYPPTLFPLFREAADPLSKELKARVAAAEKKYKTVLTYLAGELLRIHGRTAAYRSAKPLNYAAEVFAAEGLSPARDLLIGTEASQERARVQLERLEEEQAARRMQRALEEETEAQAVRARQYLIIIEQKLGGPRLNAVILNLQASRADIDNPQAVLAAVTATTPPRRPRDQGGKTSKGRPKRPAKQSAERGVDAAVVVTEYENLMKQWDLQLANKCPHLDVARNLRAAVVIGEQKKLLARLREFLPTGGKHDHANEWLPCRSCNFRAICPHALRLIELQISRAPFDEVQRVLHPFAREVDLTADPLSSNYAFYCKICGEKLYELFGNEYTIEGIRELGNFDDELKRFLWRSMMHILDPGSNTSRSAQPLVHFDRPVDPARFSAEASDICHPLILAVRTTPRFPAGSEQRALWRELLAVIYLYAYLFGLALGLPPRTGKLKVADVVKVELIPMGNFGSKGRKPASSRNAPAPDELAQILLVHLVKSQSFTISKLESVTNEQIGNQFRDAYRHIQDTHGRLLITQQDSATLLATNLTHLDPYFALLRRGVELSNPTGNISKIQSPEEAGRLFAQVMGRSLGDMLAEKPPPEYGPFARSMLARKSGIELPADVKPEWAFRIPALGLFQKAWGVRAAKQYWDRIMGGSSRTHGGGKRPTRVNKWPNTRQPGSNPPSAKLPKPSLFWDATYLMILYETSVYDDDTFKTYQEILEVARAREREARDPDVHRRLLGRRNYLEETTVPPPLPFDQITEVPLSRLYDENGQPHVWTTFLWSSEVTKPVVDMVQAASVASKVTTALVAGQRAGQQAATPDASPVAKRVASPVAKRVASPVAKRVASQPTLQLTAKETGKLLHEAYEAGESTCPLAGVPTD